MSRQHSAGTPFRRTASALGAARRITVLWPASSSTSGGVSRKSASVVDIDVAYMLGPGAPRTANPYPEIGHSLENVANNWLRLASIKHEN